VSRVIASKMLVMVVALLAALMAALRLTDILQFVSAAFSLAAAAFFPALVMGIFWQPCQPRGRCGRHAGRDWGFAWRTWPLNLPIARSLLGVTAPLSQTQWWGVDAIAAGVFAVPLGLLVLVVVSLATPAPQAEKRALVDRLRVPAEPGG
jgi:cation/acetate symporter